MPRNSSGLTKKGAGALIPPLFAGVASSSDGGISKSFFGSYYNGRYFFVCQLCKVTGKVFLAFNNQLGCFALITLALCFKPGTGTTTPPPLRGDIGIFRSVFVAVFAMRSICSSVFMVFVKDKFVHGYYFLVRKAPPRPLDYGIYFLASYISKIGRNIFFTFNYQSNGVSFITLLFFAGGPTTIFRVVTFVIIGSVKRFANWAFTHVSQEIKIVVPAFAYFYSSATIVFVRCTFCVIAPVKKPNPDIVQWGQYKLWSHLVTPSFCVPGMNNTHCLTMGGVDAA